MKTMKLLITAAVLCCCIPFLSCSRPPLDVRQESDSVVIDVATLGEYPTTITRLRISNQTTGAVIWEVAVSSGTPQLWEVELSVGPNSSQPPKAVHGSYAIVFPSDAETFTLDPEIAYTVELWGEGTRPAKAAITIEPPNKG